jgi:Protein of unknown function (DUF1275)
MVGFGEGGAVVGTSSGHPGATRRVEPLLLALSLLTVVTGLVDAACYLGLGRVFTANMTGNVVLLAFGAAGRRGCRCWRPACRWWCSWPAPPRVGGSPTA